MSPLQSQHINLQVERDDASQSLRSEPSQNGGYRTRLAFAKASRKKWISFGEEFVFVAERQMNLARSFKAGIEGVNSCHVASATICVNVSAVADATSFGGSGGDPGLKKRCVKIRSRRTKGVSSSSPKQLFTTKAITWKPFRLRAFGAGNAEF